MGRDFELAVLDLDPFPFERDIQLFEFLGDGLLAPAPRRVAAAPDPPRDGADALIAE